jgi:hypothetical protein
MQSRCLRRRPADLAALSGQDATAAVIALMDDWRPALPRPTSLFLSGISPQGDGNRATIAAKIALRSAHDDLCLPSKASARGQDIQIGMNPRAQRPAGGA